MSGSPAGVQGSAARTETAAPASTPWTSTSSSSEDGHSRPPRSSTPRASPTQLAVVPAHHPLHVHPDPHPLVQHRLDGGLGGRGHGTDVALEDAHADLPQAVATPDDLRPAHELHSPQLLVGHAPLDQA